MLFDHSLNGTFVAGEALTPGEPASSAVNLEVELGRRPGVAWRALEESKSLAKFARLGECPCCGSASAKLLL